MISEPVEPSVRRSRAGQHLAQLDIARAREDFLRLRGAYLELTQKEQGHEVALAMVGADMQRAHVNLQKLSGLRQLPFDWAAPNVATGEVSQDACKGVAHEPVQH